MSERTAVREANSADIPAMIGLERRCATASHWRDADYTRIFAVDAPLRLALVVEEAGELLGFMVTTSVGPEWEIENLIVGENARRRGLGRQLIAELMNVVRQQGGTSVFLEVRDSNDGARRFYERLGFAEIGRRRGYYSGPEEDAVIYRKCCPVDGRATNLE